MKIVVYLSCVPRKTKHAAKQQLLMRFAEGVKKSNDHCEIITDDRIVDSDIAVIQGWIGMKAGPHLALRNAVIEHQKRTNKHTLVIDSNLFGFLDIDDKDRYLRYSLNGIFPTTGYYFSNNIDGDRWQSIKDEYGFQEKDWRVDGKTILICLQRNHGWSMAQVSNQEWISQLIPKIRRYSSRPIVIREHPGDKGRASTLVINDNNWRISTQEDIREDLKETWCTITYNSSPGVASLLYGVPVIVTDPDPRRSQCFPFCDTDLSKIENPSLMDRKNFYDVISQCHFNREEIISGYAWKFMRNRLPN